MLSNVVQDFLFLPCQGGNAHIASLAQLVGT
jgi:hypothetical protein